MGLVTVRCPACRGQSRVDAASLQLLVQCPRCSETFVALEEAELVAPGPRNPPAPPRRFPEPLPAYPPAPEPQPAEDHDPHRIPPGALPPSVMIGLALLPFAIPILWMIAPAVFGLEPMLSWAVPLALAVTTSILCLAVIYTIDWTPATRVKGVLMMVGLAYFAAVNLYFLKKQMVDDVKKFLGTNADWVWFTRGEGYRVMMPTEPELTNDQPLHRLAQLTCYKATHEEPFIGPYHFVVGSGRPQGNPNGPAPGTDEWFDLARGRIVDRGGRLKDENKTIRHQEFPGRQLVIDLGGGHVRVVRVFLVKGQVYYLCAEGPGLTEDNDQVSEFFDSFLVLNAGN